MLAAKSPTSLYDTIQIPVRREFVSLTGGYESAVLLNQIIFSNKEELTLKDIRRLSLSDRTKQTLRKKLDALVGRGLIRKRRGGMYGEYFYKPAAEVYPHDSSIVALIEGLDLKEQPCYLTAAILNKFRQLVLSNETSIRISAENLRRILGTERSESLVRLILRRLVKRGYLSEELTGGVYAYRINAGKFLDSFDPEETERRAAELAKIFIACSRLRGSVMDSKQTSSRKTSFKRMLVSGYDFSSIKHIIAYLGLNRGLYGYISTPVQLKRAYDELCPEAYSKLSRRKAFRFLYKLLNGMVTAAPSAVSAAVSPEPVKAAGSDNQVTDETPGVIDTWLKAKEFVDSRVGTFRRWYFKQAAGVTDVDFEDYVAQAVVFAYERFSKGTDDDLNVSGIKYRLQDYMYRKRRSDKSADTSETEVNNILRYHDGDISEIIDRIEIEAPEEPEEVSGIRPTVAKLLGSLDPRTAAIIADYHGLEGRSYTFKEIAEKYGLSSDGYANRLYHKGIEKLRSQPPPGLDLSRSSTE